jgi:hypothetical protein
MNIDWKSKLISRKLWIAVAGLAIAVVDLVSNPSNATNEITAVVLALGSVVSYIVGEGMTDVASINADTTKRSEIITSTKQLTPDEVKSLNS